MIDLALLSTCIGIVFAVWIFLYTTSLTIPKNLLEKYADIMVFVFYHGKMTECTEEENDKEENISKQIELQSLKSSIIDAERTFINFFYDIDMAVNLFLYYLIAVFLVLLCILVLTLNPVFETWASILCVLIMSTYNIIIYMLFAHLGKIRKYWKILERLTVSSRNRLSLPMLLFIILYGSASNISLIIALLYTANWLAVWEIGILISFALHMIMCVLPTMKYMPLSILVSLWRKRQQWIQNNDF